MIRYSFSTVLALVLTFAASTAARVYAQPPAAPEAPADPAAQAAAQPSDDDDAKFRPLEPDFVTINLPTTLPLPAHAMNFSSHAPVQRGPAQRQLRDAVRQPVRPRQRRQHRPRVSLRGDETSRSDRDAHQPRQDVSVHRQVRRLASDRDVSGRPVGDRLDRRREQLPQHRRRRPGQLRAGARRRCLPEHRRSAGALRDADVGAQHRHRWRGNERYRLLRPRQPRCASARARSSCSKGLRAWAVS